MEHSVCPRLVPIGLRGTLEKTNPSSPRGCSLCRCDVEVDPQPHQSWASSWFRSKKACGYKPDLLSCPRRQVQLWGPLVKASLLPEGSTWKMFGVEGTF
eukprot:1148243-Pelagomonas_calceolata.AAC.1